MVLLCRIQIAIGQELGASGLEGLNASARFWVVLWKICSFVLPYYWGWLCYVMLCQPNVIGSLAMDLDML